MVDTTSMTNIELINTINEIKKKYHDGELLIWFYREVKSLNDDIMASVPDKLYQDFKIELRCVYNESLYGDGEYTDHVVNDCINVLDAIIATLTPTND
jgi:hypothetical protein